MPSSKSQTDNFLVSFSECRLLARRNVQQNICLCITLCILNLKDACKKEFAVKLDDKVFLDEKNGDVSLLSESMAKEEESLIKAREKEEEVNDPKEAPDLNDLQFSKLDELLTQTQLYSEFLLEKMDNITVVYPWFFLES